MSNDPRWPSSPELDQWADRLMKQVDRMPLEQLIARHQELLAELSNPLLGRAGQMWGYEFYFIASAIRKIVRYMDYGA